MSRALVLGGGGGAGGAWELGVVAALRDEGVDLVAADLILGTSAGAAVAAQISSGTDFAELVARQLSEETAELHAELDLDVLLPIFTALTDESIEPHERRAQVGRAALDAPT